MQDTTYFETHFGVTAALIQRVLGEALSSGGDFADLFFQHSTHSSLSMQDHRVHQASGTVMLGVGVRVVKGDQTGYAYTEQLTWPRLRDAARTAALIADGPARLGPVGFGGKTLTPYYDRDYDWGAIGVE